MGIASMSSLNLPASVPFRRAIFFTNPVNIVILTPCMEILFQSAKLQRLCEDARLMLREFGEANARKLRSRLADLSAAKSVMELTAGRPHPLKGDRAGQFALDLHGGARLVFEPADEPVPLDMDGAISWRHVTSVRIIFIGDYHD